MITLSTVITTEADNQLHIWVVYYTAHIVVLNTVRIYPDIRQLVTKTSILAIPDTRR